MSRQVYDTRNLEGRSFTPLVDADTYQQQMQFAMKIADFVICRPDMSIVCIVELDDSTHKPLKDMQRGAITSKAGSPTSATNPATSRQLLKSPIPCVTWTQ